MNTARLRLRRRRNGRRLHALILLVGIVLVTGLAIGSRSGREVGGPGSESDEVMAASPWVGADWSAIGSAGGPTDSWAGIFPAADSPAASPARLPGGSQGDAHSQAGAPLDHLLTDAGGKSLAGLEAAETPGERQEENPADKPVIFVHEVRSGDTLSHIAAAYGVDVETIAAANDLVQLNRIMPGDKLRIPSVKGALHVVSRGESLWDIARAYQVSMEKIIETNGLTHPERLYVGQELVIPGAQALAVARRREAVVGRDGSLLRNFDWPVRGRISSRFGPRWGRMHYGLDIAVPTGTPVRAAAAGVVRFSGWQGGYGYLVIVDHGNGVETRYAHNSRLVVRARQRVARGEVLAYSGNTGNSTGPHVHFEIRHRGRAVNPEHYLKR